MAGNATLPNKHAWIFVSHASADLPSVRKVRNYLEEQGASPLLFHLLSLKRPAEFWPLIKREIHERNFFLYCDSDGAENSAWVRRERAEVARVRRKRPKRVARIKVDAANLDFMQLDLLLADLRVQPAYAGHDSARVRPFLDALAEAGFEILDSYRKETGPSIYRAFREEGQLARQNGWTVWFGYLGEDMRELELQLKADPASAERTLLVQLDAWPLLSDFASLTCIDGRGRKGPARLVSALLTK